MTTECPYTILVSSTDLFRDCWEPFFTLLGDYWPRPLPPVCLCTETEFYEHPDVPIRVVHVGGGGGERHPTWSTAILRCLEAIETDLVLYLQDDYFLYDSVRVDVVDEVVALMLAEGIECVRLMECGGSGPWLPSEHELIWRVDRRAPYRISLQAALWRGDALRKYLRRHESPWQFEVWGSRRATRLGGDIACLARDRVNDEVGQVIPYVPTGIVKGRWNREVVVDLFAAHGINVDYAQRGFWDPSLQPRPRRSVRSAIDRLKSW